MSKITDTILKEKMKVRPNKNYIQMLQQLSEKDTFTFDDFVRSARVVPRASFIAESEGAKLLDECSDIYCYVGGLFIQGLRGGYFYSEVYQKQNDCHPCIKIDTTDLSLLEKILYSYCMNL
jgi:hypothetical protein